MQDDPHRRATFGTTIENYTTRVLQLLGCCRRGFRFFRCGCLFEKNKDVALTRHEWIPGHNVNKGVQCNENTDLSHGYQLIAS